MWHTTCYNRFHGEFLIQGGAFAQPNTNLDMNEEQVDILSSHFFTLKCKLNIYLHISWVKNPKITQFGPSSFLSNRMRRERFRFQIFAPPTQFRPNPETFSFRPLPVHNDQFLLSNKTNRAR